MTDPIQEFIDEHSISMKIEFLGFASEHSDDIRIKYILEREGRLICIERLQNRYDEQLSLLTFFTRVFRAVQHVLLCDREWRSWVMEVVHSDWDRHSEPSEINYPAESTIFNEILRWDEKLEFFLTPESYAALLKIKLEPTYWYPAMSGFASDED